MLHRDVGSRQLNPCARAIVEYELELVGAWELLHQDVELLQQPHTGVVVLAARHHHTQDAPFLIRIRNTIGAVGLRESVGLRVHRRRRRRWWWWWRSPLRGRRPLVHPI